MDALASVAFSVIAVQTLKQLGFSSKKEYISTIWVVGIVVALAFSALYIGLGFLGNHFPVPAEVMKGGTPGVLYLVASNSGNLWFNSSTLPRCYGNCNLLHNDSWIDCVDSRVL
mgnify:CR=1 FL=1